MVAGDHGNPLRGNRWDNAGKLRAETVDLDMSGLGGATVHASRAAEVDLSGMGSATVYGKPASRRANTSGMGKVAWK